MDIWMIPHSFVLTSLGLLLYLGLVSRRAQRVAFNISEYLVEKKGTGVSSSSVGGVFKRITPSWVRICVWLTSFSSLGMLIYIGMRYGWPWALGYALGDHLLKSVEIPIFPSVDRSYGLIEQQAQKNAPKLVTQAIAEYRQDYVHT